VRQHRRGSFTTLLAPWPRASPFFRAGTGRFTIGITGGDGITYHVHHTTVEAQRFVEFAIGWILDLVEAPEARSPPLAPQ
jgi:hypothetical protein